MLMLSIQILAFPYVVIIIIENSALVLGFASNALNFILKSFASFDTHFNASWEQLHNCIMQL